MKKIISIFLLLLLSSCGYSSVYKNNKSNDLMIILTDMQGDRKMNNLIKTQLELYSSKNSNDKFYIIFNSDYKKSIISKSSSGSASNYELYVRVDFEITYNEKIDKISIEEKFNIKNISDAYEQKNYENIVKNNFTSSIRKKLILKLLSIK